MRTIAHISDLHFGRVDRRIAEGLLADLEQIKPDLVVISGDLTQRARRAQFAAARDYLARIPYPQIVVPGNHDVPLYDFVRRLLWPLDRYRDYITEDLMPVYQDEKLGVLGVNTARSLTWKNGWLDREQIELMRTRLLAMGPGDAAEKAGEDLFKIVVTHHPFIPPPNDPRPALVGRAPEALAVLEACGVELILAGHLHVNYTGDVRSHHVMIKRHIMVAQAGTATSTRRRNEPNAYNHIIVNPPQLSLGVRAWNGQRFEHLSVERFEKQEGEWLLQPDDDGGP